MTGESILAKLRAEANARLGEWRWLGIFDGEMERAFCTVPFHLVGDNADIQTLCRELDRGGPHSRPDYAMFARLVEPSEMSLWELGRFLNRLQCGGRLLGRLWLREPALCERVRELLDLRV